MISFPGSFAEYFDWYIVAAVPVAFFSAAIVGVIMERTVIRWLYGRALETLLTTWGISLILIQPFVSHSVHLTRKLPIQHGYQAVWK